MGASEKGVCKNRNRLTNRTKLFCPLGWAHICAEHFSFLWQRAKWVETSLQEQCLQSLRSHRQMNQANLHKGTGSVEYNSNEHLLSLGTRALYTWYTSYTWLS